MRDSRRNGMGARMGDLTADQMRQIAASSNKGISESVKAAEAVGADNARASATASAIASEIGAWEATHQLPRPAGIGRTVVVLGLVGVGAYLLLRRRGRRGRK